MDFGFFKRGPAEVCLKCGSVRRLFGRTDKYTGTVYGDDIPGFWELEKQEKCSGHSWSKKSLPGASNSFLDGFRTKA